MKTWRCMSSKCAATHPYADSDEIDGFIEFDSSGSQNDIRFRDCPECGAPQIPHLDTAQAKIEEAQ